MLSVERVILIDLDRVALVLVMGTKAEAYAKAALADDARTQMKYD